jgi:putative DNA-invertase from lambdoid prophage Rac
MTAMVVPFPSARRRTQIRKTAAFMLSVAHNHAEGHLREQLRRLRSGLLLKGVPEDVVERECGRQAEEGESLGAQQRRVEGYAQMLDLTVDRHFVERAVSGSVPVRDRPEGSVLLKLVKPGDTIITPKLDRMFRSALDALDVLRQLKDRGVSLHMIDLNGDVTGNGIAKLVFTILSAVAEAERDRIRERISDIKRDQKQRGRYLGGTLPFGYRRGDGGNLVPHPDEQRAIKQVRALNAKGNRCGPLAATMKAKGFQMSHVAVARILRDDAAGKPETRSN